jgi:hypothetical protein
MPILDEHDDPDDISKRIMGRLNPIVDQWRGKVYVAQDFWTYHNNRETYGHVMPKTTDVGW